MGCGYSTEVRQTPLDREVVGLVPSSSWSLPLFFLIYLYKINALRCSQRQTKPNAHGTDKNVERSYESEDNELNVVKLYHGKIQCEFAFIAHMCSKRRSRWRKILLQFRPCWCIRT